MLSEGEEEADGIVNKKPKPNTIELMYFREIYLFPLEFGVIFTYFFNSLLLEWEGFGGGVSWDKLLAPPLKSGR